MFFPARTNVDVFIVILVPYAYWILFLRLTDADHTTASKVIHFHSIIKETVIVNEL